jgi:hypothetical protein
MPPAISNAFPAGRGVFDSSKIIFNKEQGENVEKEAYRVSEFCQRYAISKASFYRETAASRLGIIKRGRTTLVARVEAERWFDKLCQGQTQQHV